MKITILKQLILFIYFKDIQNQILYHIYLQKIKNLNHTNKINNFKIKQILTIYSLYYCHILIFINNNNILMMIFYCSKILI